MSPVPLNLLIHPPPLPDLTLKPFPQHLNFPIIQCRILSPMFRYAIARQTPIFARSPRLVYLPQRQPYQARAGWRLL